MSCLYVVSVCRVCTLLLQWHPEASGGPTDTAFILDDFVTKVIERQHVTGGGEDGEEDTDGGEVDTDEKEKEKEGEKAKEDEKEKKGSSTMAAGPAALSAAASARTVGGRQYRVLILGSGEILGIFNNIQCSEICTLLNQIFTL